jgi:uncharacterized membrane protein
MRHRSVLSALPGAALAALAALATCSGIGAAAAQTPPAGDQFKPYVQVSPVRGDESTVRAFFSPSCAYSKMYFQFFKNLSATLPTNKTFEFTPVVNFGDGIGYALSFVAVKRYYPAYVNNFVEASLIGTQDKHLSTRSWAGIEAIGRAARVPVSVPRLVSEHMDELRPLVVASIKRQNALAITNTPAVSVNGTYVVTPEFTSGDARLFSQLVNGVISMQ